MRKMRFSRRDLLKAAAIGAGAFTVRADAAEPVTPTLVAAATKEGKLAFYTAMDLPIAEKLGKAFEAKYPGIAVRVERSGSERVFQRIGPGDDEAGFPPSTWSTARMPRTSSCGSGTAGSHPIFRKRSRGHYPAQFFDPDGLFTTTRLWFSSLGYNANLVQAGGRAKKLCRSARSEMVGQDGEGPPQLQLHDHDRDLPDRARIGLAVSREARQAEGHAGAVLDRSAEEAGARRARRNGRRQRLQSDPAQGGGAAGRGDLSVPKGTPTVTGPSGVFKSAPNPNAARLFQNWLHSREASSCWSMCPASIPSMRRSRTRRARASSRTSSCGGTIPQASSRRATTSRSATPRSSRCDRQTHDHRAARRERPRNAPDRPVVAGLDLIRGGSLRADRAADVLAVLLQLRRPAPVHSRSATSRRSSPTLIFSTRW